MTPTTPSADALRALARFKPHIYYQDKPSDTYHGLMPDPSGRFVLYDDVINALSAPPATPPADAAGGGREPCHHCGGTDHSSAGDYCNALSTPPASDAPATVGDDAAARRLYVAWVDSQNMHCNRFPAWSELSEETRERYRIAARTADAPDANP